MSVARESTRALLLKLAALLVLVDTAWGVVAVLPFDWTLPNEALLGVSFLLGLPAYLLDFWNKRRVVIALPAVVLFRGCAEFYAGSPHPLGWQLWGNQLLIAALVILQWSKLQRRKGAENLESPARS